MINTSYKRYPLGSTTLHAVATIVPSPLDRSDALSVARKVVGRLGAVMYAVFKTVPGAVQGLVRSSQFSRTDVEPDKTSTGIYTVTAVSESMLAGAALFGAAAGPLGIGVGTGVGFLVGVLGRVAECKARTATEFVQNVDSRVDSYLAFAAEEHRWPILHNMVDGTRIGAQAGWRQGLTQGWDAGVGLLDATCDGLSNLREVVLGR